MSDQQAHADNLRASRAETLKNSARKAKKNIQAAMNGVSLMAHIDPFMDWLFAIALMAAMLKDILDIINNALIAAGGIGAALIFLLTIMTSLVIGFVMILTGSTGKTKVAKTIAKRITILILATIAMLK